MWDGSGFSNTATVSITVSAAEVVDRVTDDRQSSDSTVLGTGTAQVFYDGETYEMRVELMAKDDQLTSIVMVEQDETLEIVLTGSSEDGQWEGFLRPCDDGSDPWAERPEGNSCLCYLSASDEEAPIQGTCDHWESGQIEIDIWLDSPEQ